MSPKMDFEENDADEPDADAESEHNHLKDLSDGAGCAEIWEHLSESREE